MSFRQSDRWEYIKQPHILALLVLGIAVVGGAVYTTASRLQDTSRRSQLPVDQACAELVKDEDLCKFASSSRSYTNTSYTSVTTTVQDGVTSLTTSEFENANRIRTVTQTNGQETEGLLLLEADNYARDYTDGTWAHYRDNSYEAIDTSGLATEYDFSSEASSDVIEFRDYYKRAGQEPCGELQCLKYEILPTDGTTQTTFIWFDLQEYRLRRVQAVSGQNTSNTQYDYKPVVLTAPTPVKEVDEATFSTYLQ